MEIICGKTAGFCFGVKRTVDLVKKELEKKTKLYCLGKLVHNDHVIQELINLGMIQIENLSEVSEGSSVLIRSHGVPPEIYSEAKERKIELIDLTCPKVKTVYNLASKYKEKNAYIIITGEKDHPETIGIKGWAGESNIVITNVEEAESINLLNKNNVVILSQTTYSMSKFEQIENILKNKNGSIKIINTICSATQERQEETKNIAKDVDLMIIIGGKKSSNTKKLYDISKEFCKEVIFVQDSNDINNEKLVSFKKIGIMAGASTPHELIGNIITKIKKLEIQRIL